MIPTTSAPGDAPVSAIMSRDYVVVRESLDVESLASFMHERHLTHAAVADDRGVVIGYVSMLDLARESFRSADRPERPEDADGPVTPRMLPALPHPTSTAERPLTDALESFVADMMVPFVLRLPESATIDEAAATMASEGVSRVLVVSPSGAVTGILSAIDVLRWVAWRDGYGAGPSSHAGEPPTRAPIPP